MSMHIKNRNKGFTLIELLVVIAIIGILASVVLASLNTARAKGADAAIKSSINNGRAQAEIFYDNTASSYGTAGGGAGSVCMDPVIQNIKTAVNNAGGVFACNNSLTAYAIASPLKTDATKFYCVDSTGKSNVGVTLGAATACP